MNLQKDSLAHEVDFDREYWDEKIVKRDGELFIDNVRESLGRFLQLTPSGKKCVKDSRRFQRAYDYFCHTFHSSHQIKVLFGKRVYNELLRFKNNNY